MVKKPAQSLSKYYFAIMIAYIIWAASGPVIKLTLQSVPPFTFLFLRLLIVCILILPYTWRLLKTNSIVKQDYLNIFILGLFSQSALILIFLGFKYTTALEATIIGMLGPILSVVAGHYFYHEKIDGHVKTGLILATLGTLFVAIEPILQPQGLTHEVGVRIMGNLFVVAYSLSFLLYVIWSKITLGINSDNIKRTLKLIHMKPMKKHYSPLLLMSLSFYVGFLTFIPMAVLEAGGYLGNKPFSITSLTLTPILGIVFMAIFGSIVAYYLFEWSLEKIEVKDTALFSYLQPVFTLPFAYILLGEIPNEYMILGAAVIAVGVLIAEQKKS
ncbi:DMT family transporter [Patescibacteria group bacterium]